MYFGNKCIEVNNMKWEKQETEDLNNAVCKCQEFDLPISNAFRAHADKYMRSVSGVKKHYYKFCKQKAMRNVINIGEYQNPKITEKDLEALFRGLVKMIREQIQSDKNGT